VVPDDHLVRQINSVLDLSWVHAELAPTTRWSAATPSFARTEKAGTDTIRVLPQA